MNDVTFLELSFLSSLFIYLGSFLIFWKLWPWSGYFAVHITASKEAADWDGLAKGMISFNVTSPPKVFYSNSCLFSTN